MDYRANITAAVKDAVLATGVNIHDRNRYHAVTWHTNRAITILFRQAALRGVERQVIDGFFKLSAHEMHRLPALVKSIWEGRVADVGRALIAYDANH